MAESSFTCNVSQGFNFQKDVQDFIGHFNSIKIAGKDDLKSDLRVSDPEESAKMVKVFGIISSIYWNGGYADPIQIGCQVSTDSKNNLAILLHRSLANTEVDFTFTIYDFDPKEATYFKCFHSGDAVLKGLVLKQGGELAMQLDEMEGAEVPSPRNFGFNIGIMPRDLNQAIQLAVSVSGKLSKKWGVEVAG